jgi:hypothetical protein
MLQRVLSRIKRRMRAAEIRDRLAVTSGKLTRLAMLDRRGNRALLVAQLAALEERLGDGWDEHRISEIMENYEHNVEKLTAAFQ